MKKLIAPALLLLLLLCSSWGFWAHQKINEVAIFTLPYEMLPFYKSHMEELVAQAIAPDQRKHAVEEEAPRHFIDIDQYGEYPFPDFPREWDSAVAKYTEDTLQQYGIVPWHTVSVYHWLVKAMREHDGEAIIRLSGDLGHYVADAHVPLHTTLNYNGQLTGQVGIHGFWESRLPELFGNSYNYVVGKADYIEDPQEAMWEAVLESHRLVDSVLSIEKALSKSFPQDQQYTFEERGSSVQKQPSREYSRAYHEAMNGMVERRMRAAIHLTGSLWYSAWIDAGQPDLSDLQERPLPQQPKEFEGGQHETREE